jgi:hypothetical protein
MALDRFVRFKSKAPRLHLVRRTLEDYLGGAAEKVYTDGFRIYAVLRGKPSFPFRRMRGMKRFAATSEAYDERWLEVYVDKKYIDVITRMTDEYTNNVAEGFARLCERYWHGTMDE